MSPHVAAARGTRPASAARVQVRLLGPAVITGALQPLQPKQAELVYALSLSTPPGLSGSALQTMLGADPDHAKPADGLRQVITRTRRRMGAALDGGEYIGYRDGRYFMAGAWRDWEAFTALGARGREAGAAPRCGRRWAWCAASRATGPSTGGWSPP